jgi:hypothetical protein
MILTLFVKVYGESLQVLLITTLKDNVYAK